MTTTPEQAARDLLERMGVPDAQSYTAGDLVELANVIATAAKMTTQAHCQTCTCTALRAEGFTHVQHGHEPAV